MAAKKATEGTQVIKIKPVRVSKADITIVGDTPLCVHKWSEKARKELLDTKQNKKTDKRKKPPCDPFAEFMDALYWITPEPEEKTPEAFEDAIMHGAKFGFPITAIKQAALAACYRSAQIPNQVGMKCSFFLNATEGYDDGTGMELALIDTDEPPELREDPVKVGGATKNADLRYRPIFRKWKIRMTISLIETGIFSMESVVNAINLGGMMNGIGEWRMERNGDFGRFHVQLEGE